MPFTDPRTQFLFQQEAQQGPQLAPQELSFLQPGGGQSGGGMAPGMGGVNPRDMFMGLAAIMPLLDQPREMLGQAPGSPHVGDAKLAPALQPAQKPGAPRIPGLNSFLLPR